MDTEAEEVFLGVSTHLKIKGERSITQYSVYFLDTLPLG